MSFGVAGPRSAIVSQGSWVRYPVWQHTFLSPSAFSRRAVVSYWRKYVHKVLVNRLGGLSLPRKSVVRLTDGPDMTLDVYRGRKTTMQQQQQQISLVFGLWFSGVAGRSGRPHCHHDQLLVHKPVWWWYWKDLLSGGLISVCWRLADILRQHPLRPCAQEIQPHTHVCPLLHWNKPCVRHLLTSHQSFSSASRRAPLCSSDTCSLQESAVQVSHLASEFSHSMFQQRCSPYLKFSWSLVHQWHTCHLRPGV